MDSSLFQQYKIGQYIIKQKLNEVKKFPIVLMLEPKFKCNLSCKGCGKIDFPEAALNEYLSPERCFYAANECNAPVVSICGGEPLLHEDLPEIVEGLIKQKRIVYICTNGLLVPKHIYDYEPSKYLHWSFHLDGFEEDHEKIINQKGVYSDVINSIKLAKTKGFNVTVNTTIFLHQRTKSTIDFLTFLSDDLKVDGINISPSYSYERAPDKENFLNRESIKRIFRAIFLNKKFKNWKFNQTILYLDFLAGNQSYTCNPWTNPTYNIFGWQKPCYHLHEGYVKTFQELMENTDWKQYGTGNYEKCNDCMTHCGYEGTAIEDMYDNPLKAFKKKFFGIKTRGPMAPEINVQGARPAQDVYDRLITNKLYDLDLI